MLKVLGDRVLVLLEPSPPDVVTESGIILQRDPDYRKVPTRGIVAQLGEKTGMCAIDDAREVVQDWFEDHQVPTVYLPGHLDALLLSLRPAPFDVAVGNCVIFAPGDGEEVEFDGHAYVILREGEILGVVEPVIGDTQDFNTLSLQRAYEELQAAGLLPEG